MRVSAGIGWPGNLMNGLHDALAARLAWASSVCLFPDESTESQVDDANGGALAVAGVSFVDLPASIGESGVWIVWRVGCCFDARG